MTNVASTSIETYRALRDDGTLGKRQAEVLAAVQPGLDYSLQELARATGLGINCIAGRCFELREMGLLELAPVRPCSLTTRHIKPVRRPAIDLDAIKAAGLNSDAESERMLAAHRIAERSEVDPNGR
jgi:hypothetical protein